MTASIPGRADEPPRGTVIGRYVVLDRVGSGAMGAVYRAYDPELDRRVAVKLVGGGLRDTDKAGLRSRLLREARAMAAIVHPNVITVHDVGTFEDEVFIAMEFVEGSSLRGWLASDARSSAEIIEVFAAAGRGLAAAHARGLVHRDFKPDNVLIGHDERVRVTDFGLVRRTVEPTTVRDLPPADEVAAWRVTTMSRTAAGAIVGTPAYMAPEQIAGLDADPRSDQFSFCVALFEALTGQRPFEGATLSDVAEAIERGSISAPASLSKVPRRVRRALIKGLSETPDARHRDMTALLRELAPRRRGLWRAALVVLPIAALVGGSFAWTRPEPDACDQIDDRLATVWNGDRRAEIRNAFLDTGRPAAEQAWDTVQVQFGAYARLWTDAMHAQCVAGQTGADQPAAVALRTACLGRQLDAMQELVDVLLRADGDVVDRAATVAAQLPDVLDCADAQRLAAIAGLTDPTSSPDRVDAITQAIARATAEHAAGHYEAALTQATSAVVAAESLGHPSLEAEALYHQGRLSGLLGQDPRAEELLRRATLIAVGARHHRVAAKALTELVYVVGISLRQPKRGHDIARWARAEIDALGGSDGIKASLLSNLGSLARSEHRLDESLAFMNEALELQQGADSDLVRAALLFNISTVELERGDLARGEAISNELLELTTRRFGTDHPTTASAHVALARVLNYQGRFNDALEHAERGAAIQAKIFPPEHVEIETSWARRGDLLHSLGRWQEAEHALRMALEAAQQREGPESYAAGVAWGGLSYILRETGTAVEAEAAGRRSLEILDALLPPNDPQRATALSAVGYGLSDQGRYDEAADLLEQALAIELETFEPDSAEIGSALMSLGGALARAGRRTEAIEVNERALAIYQQIERPAWEQGDIEFALAGVLPPSESERACDLARSARARFAMDEGEHSEMIAEIDAWIADRPRCPAVRDDRNNPEPDGQSSQ